MKKKKTQTQTHGILLQTRLLLKVVPFLMKSKRNSKKIVISTFFIIIVSFQNVFFL